MKNFTHLFAFLILLQFSAFGQESILYPPNPEADDEFGVAVDMSSNYAIVGSQGRDKAAIYELNNGQWIFDQEIDGRTDPNATPIFTFGYSVAIDGNVAVVGAPAEFSGTGGGTVYIYEKIGGTWNLQQTLSSPFPAYRYAFGRDVDISGDRIAIGARGTQVGGPASSSAVYIFRKSGSDWIEETSFDDNRADLALDGNTIALEGSNDIQIYTRSGTSWTLQATIAEGNATSMDLSGNTLAYGLSNGFNQFGEVVVYERSGSTWNLSTSLIGDDVTQSDRFGQGDISVSGNFIATGTTRDAYDAGTVYIFEKNGSSWPQFSKLTALDMQEAGSQPGNSFGGKYGFVVNLEGNNLIVGSPAKFDNGPESGAAYAYQLNNLPSGPCTSNFDGYTLLGEYGVDKLYISDNILSWPLANTAAQAIGGNLVTINNAQKGYLVRTEISDLAYIGFNDATSEGNFTWADGTEVLYDAFDGDNSSAKDYGYIKFWNGEWALEQDGIYRKYIVELECNTASANLTANCPSTYDVTAPPGASGMIANWPEPNATTTCPDGVVSIVQTQGPANGSFIEASNGFEQIRYSITDNCGNTTFCTFAVYVRPADEGVLTINCPEDVEVNLPAGTTQFNISFPVPTASTTCPGGAVTITQNRGPAQNELVSATTRHLIQYRITDICGNSTFCTFYVQPTFSAQDQVSITCPANISVTAPAGSSGVNVNWSEGDINVSTNCNSFDVNQVIGLVNGALFPIGIRTVSYEATANCASGTLYDQCSFTVTVTEETVGGECPASIAGFTVIGEFENHKYFLSTSKKTYGDAQQIAASNGGYLASINSSAENQFVFAGISESSWIGFNDRASEGSSVWDSGEPVTYNAFQGTNNGSNDNGLMYSWNGNWGFENNSVWRYYVLEVPCQGNPGSDLTINCPNNITLTTASPGGSVDLSWSLPSTNSTCNNSTVTLTQTSGPARNSSVTAGSYTVVYQGTDACGNSETCSFNVLVQDGGNGGAADLSMAGLSVQNQITIGQLFPYSFDLINSGTEDVDGDFQVLAYLSLDQNLNTSSDILVGELLSGNTPANTTIPNVPSAALAEIGTIQPGNYYLILSVNANQTVSESNYNNNTVRTSNRIAVVGEPTGGDGIDLELNLSVNPSALNIWNNNTFTVSVTNTGTEAATGVVVNFSMPDGFVYTSASTSQGQWSNWNGNWNLNGAIEPGETATLTAVLFALTGDGPITAYAEVESMNGTDEDSTPGNGNGVSANEDDEASLSLGSTAALQQLEKEGTLLRIEKVFPNPASDYLIVDIYSDSERETVVQIIDARGRKQTQQTLSLYEGDNQVAFEVSNLPAGLYTLLMEGMIMRGGTTKFLKIKN